MTDKRAIARAFGQAADSYDDSASLQREVACALAQRIASLSLAPRPGILDIGCGTGFVGEALSRVIAEPDFLFTDLSPAMLARCRAKLGNTGARFLAMDGEAPALKAGTFDLITSSFASQWFTDPSAALRRLSELLAPGGILAVATVGSGSFQEWRDLTERHGIPSGVPIYPSLKTWRSIWPHADVSVSEELRQVAFPNGYEFLRDLKRIGANSAQAGHEPAQPGSLRRLLRDTAAGFVATYRVVYVIYRRV